MRWLSNKIYIAHTNKPHSEPAVIPAWQTSTFPGGEPCAGLSKAETETMISAIADLAKSSKATFIIVEHDMQVVELLSDHVLVMHQGRLLAQGSLEQIRANPEVKRVYAGGSK